jgi:hypothetical protein
MPPPAYIHRRLRALPAEEQVQALLRRSICRKSIRAISPSIASAWRWASPCSLKSRKRAGWGRTAYGSALITGEAGELDFRAHLDAGRELERRLLEDEALFRQFELQEGTLVWPTLGREMADVEGEVRFYAFDVDPGLLYEWAIV